MNSKWMLGLVILVLIGFSNRSFAQRRDNVFWPSAIIPPALTARWYLEEKDFFLSFDEFGVNRDSQTWPYQLVQKKGDTLRINIDFRNRALLIEVIMPSPDSIKIRTDDAIFLPTPSGDPTEFITFKKWNGQPETPQEFRDHALMYGKVYSPDVKGYEPYVAIPKTVLTPDWVKHARALQQFPSWFHGTWRYTSNDPNDDQLNLTIYPHGIVTRESDMGTYPIQYADLKCLFVHQGTFAAAFKSDRYPGGGVFWMQYKNDSLILQDFDWNNHFGMPPRVLIRTEQLKTCPLPDHLIKTYPEYDVTVLNAFFPIHLYQNSSKIRLSKTHLIWGKRRLKIKKVIEGKLALSKKTNKRNYDLVVEDPLTHQEAFLCLVYNDFQQMYFLYAFGFPRLSIDGTVSTFPWVFHLPRPGSISQNQLLAIIYGVPTFLLLALGFFIYRVRSIRRQRQHAHLTLNSLRAQLNPHFLFNALSSIQALVNRNESEGANLYLSGFAKLLRHTLYHSDQDYLRLEDELLHLRHYCELEALRSPFEYEIRVDEDIDAFNTEIPGMLLQPFVENAIVHGLRNHPGQPHLDVWIYRQGLNLVCVISDNGMGIAASLARSKSKFNVAPQKHGMSISLERIRLLNLRLGKKITLEVQDLGETTQQSGTRIIISIPMTD